MNKNTRTSILKPTLLLSAGALVLTLESTGMAFLRRDPVTLDRTSPSVLDFGSSTNDIYWVPTSPRDAFDAVGGAGPLLHVSGSNVGLATDDHVDAMSNSELNDPVTLDDNKIFGIDEAPYLYISVDASSQGAFGSHVRHQADRGQHAADRFMVLPDKTLPDAMSSGPASASGNTLSFNHERYSLIPELDPTQFNSYTPTDPTATQMDDAGSMEIIDIDTNGDNDHDTPLYFSLDATSSTLSSLSHSEADILTVAAGSSTISEFADATDLGLNETDDELDALALWDRGTEGSIDTGDYALFSLAPGSGFLTAGGNNFSPADLFVTDLAGSVELYLSHLDMGLLASDDIDGLDARSFAQGNDAQFIPEPMSAMLLAALSPMMLRRRSRDRRGSAVRA